MDITTANDFVKQQAEEWGWDYVEQKFAEGLEPVLVNGVWCWYDVQFLRTVHVDSDNSSSTLPSDRIGHSLGSRISDPNALNCISPY